MYFFRGEVIVRHTASADLRWNWWKWLTLDNSKMYLWQTRIKLKARTKSYIFKLWQTLSHLIYHCVCNVWTENNTQWVQKECGISFIIWNLTKYFVKCIKNGFVLYLCKENGIWQWLYTYLIFFIYSFVI